MATVGVAPAAGVGMVHSLPTPDPLVNLIDFGNLHKVLAYILDNLNSVGARLTKIEGNVANLQETQNLHGDSIGALKSLLVNYRPGGSDEDMQALRDKVAVMEGRLDSQTKEIVSLAHTAKEQSRTITGLESATQSLQSIMPTKADVSDLALKASKSVVDRHEREIEDLTAIVKGDHEARIKVLEAGFKRLSAAVEALTNDDFKAEAIRRITDLENQAKITVDGLNDHTRQIADLSDLVATKAAQVYVDTELENLLQRLKDLELALANSMKAELKRFERDVMIYVADQLTNASNLSNAQANANANANGSGGHTHGQNTAAGKMHYRCLTCDQPRDNVPGPSTFRYGKAMGVANISSGGGGPASESRLLETQLGDQIYLHGTDGGIYKGRTEPHNQALLLAQQQQQQQLLHGSSGMPALPSSELLRLQAGSGQVTQRSSSPDKYASSARKSRPQSADPSQSRTHAHRQQIDPASGRKSAFDLALPLSNLSGVGEEEGKVQQGESATARTLHFPTPTKSSGSGAKSGSTTSRASILPRSNSQTELMMANNAAVAAAAAQSSSMQGYGSASASASPTHPLSPLNSLRKARPSTASARPGGTISDNPGASGSSSGPPSGRLLTGHVAPEGRTHPKSKNGVEMVRDYE